MATFPTTHDATPRSWSTRREDKAQRLRRVRTSPTAGCSRTERIVEALEALLAPGDRVALEGDNQKQADFLSRSLARVDPAQVHDLHMLISSISRPEQLDIFETGHRAQDRLRLRRAAEPAGGAAARGRQARGRRDPHLCRALRPDVRRPDARAWRWSRPRRATGSGNLYTGANTEDTPTIVEATAFRDGIVIAQVNELVDDAAAGRHPGLLGRLRRRGRPAVRRSSRCSPATRA